METVAALQVYPGSPFGSPRLRRSRTRHQSGGGTGQNHGNRQHENNEITRNQSTAPSKPPRKKKGEKEGNMQLYPCHRKRPGGAEGEEKSGARRIPPSAEACFSNTIEGRSCDVTAGQLRDSDAVMSPNSY
ncbi:unnamed protein product [Pleuronectes platessa]|uniref:Uncharacterized protein n=1 Tax=Pleuronectes platessa TaxID=8262 RepID=A0A9N7YC05_PLEPL|nr:unnamed protein product [Pleuronectes platessa]